MKIQWSKSDKRHGKAVKGITAREREVRRKCTESEALFVGDHQGIMLCIYRTDA